MFRVYAQRVREELTRLPEDILSWGFWERFERGDFSEEEIGFLLRHLEEIYQLSTPQPSES